MIRKSLLFTLNKAGFDNLLVEKQMRENGFNIHYLIDTHDVINYCFPFGSRKLEPSSQSSDGIHIISDRQVALNFLLEKYDNCTVILPVEYENEIEDFKKQVIANHNEIINSDFVVARFEEELKEGHHSDLEKFIRENLTIITSLATSMSTIGLQRFIDIFKNQKISLISDLDNSLESKIDNDLKNAVFDNLSSKINKRDPFFYLESYSKKIKREGIEFKHEEFIQYVVERKEKSLLNAYLDSVVVSKVYSHNEYTLRKGNGTIFLFLSSTKLIEALPQKLLRTSTLFKNRKLCFHRNDAQIFAGLIFSIYSKNPSPELDRIKHLIATEDKYFDKEYSDRRLVETKIDKLRNSLENSALLIQHDFFASDIKSLIDDERRVKRNVGFTEKLNKVLDRIYSNRKSVSKLLSDVDQIIIELNIFDRIRRFLSIESKAFGQRNYGLDPIEGIKQQLPIVYDFESFKDNTDSIEILKNLSVFYRSSDPSIYEIENIRYYLLAYIKRSEKNDDLSHSLIQYLIYLSLPLPIKENEKRPNEYVFEKIDGVIERYKHIWKGIKLKQASKTIFKELRYVQLWAARRARLYKKGLSLTEECIEEYPTDPRFYHSECLIRYCIDFEKFFLLEQFKLDDENLIKAIEAGEKAISLYRIFVRMKENNEGYLSVEALYNTIFFTYSWLSYYEFKINKSERVSAVLLDDAESYMTYLKDLSNQIGKYKSNPEYLASESFFLLVKYYLTSDKEILWQAHALFKEVDAKRKPHNDKIAPVYTFIENEISECMLTTS